MGDSKYFSAAQAQPGVCAMERSGAGFWLRARPIGMLCWSGHLRADGARCRNEFIKATNLLQGTELSKYLLGLLEPRVEIPVSKM